jgi:predicted RNA binding protein YcfA (HicA-like mRNA interferase family)
MAYAKNVWNQIKNLTKDDIIAALLRDGWVKDPDSRDATIAYIKYTKPKNQRVVIHYHPGTVCGPGLLKHLLNDIGWEVKDLKRLNLISKK